MLSYAVAQRRREIALRVALGARPAQVRRQFLSLGLRLVGTGLLLGVAGAWMTGHALQTMLFGVPPLHAATLAVAAAVMASVAGAACLLPASRAARISPIDRVDLMMKIPCLLVLLLLWIPQPPPLRADAPHACAECDAWNKPREPFRVFGNTYYVGVADLASILVVSDTGSILLDGGLPQSAPLVDANIRKLGFKTEDVKLIVNSHAHYDHAGGIAALQRVSGATVASSPKGKEALERGEPTADDPQFAFGRRANAFPAVRNVRAVVDGETLRAGSLAITAHLVPGHTPGATTWTWRSCEGPRCYDIVYADSLNAVSAPGFRFTGDAMHPAIVRMFRESIAKVGALPCDILLAVHPGMAGIDDKLERRALKPSTDPFVDSGACRAYAADAGKRLDARLAEEARGSAVPR